METLVTIGTVFKKGEKVYVTLVYTRTLTKVIPLLSEKPDYWYISHINDDGSVDMEGMKDGRDAISLSIYPSQIVSITRERKVIEPGDDLYELCAAYAEARGEKSIAMAPAVHHAVTKRFVPHYC